MAPCVGRSLAAESAMRLAAAIKSQDQPPKRVVAQTCPDAPSVSLTVLRARIGAVASIMRATRAGKHC